MPPQQQRLIYSGRQMCVIEQKAYRSHKSYHSKKKISSPSDRPDDKTAKDFNITPGSVLHLVLALRGGGGGDGDQS